VDSQAAAPAKAVGSTGTAGRRLVQNGGTAVRTGRISRVHPRLSGNGIFYGFPERADEGFKVGKLHHRHETVDPDTIDRSIVPEDVEALAGLERYLSATMGPPMGFKTCMFVNSPDEHFIIDVLPGQQNVIVAAGFSGHGYKFCSGIGEILADLVMYGATSHDTHLFSLSRPALVMPPSC
jgi:glycine/D-amino acid oxidase-like deaminating enzyme